MKQGFRDTGIQIRVQAAALEAAANGILIADETGKILWINRAITRMTGYAPEELIGQNPRALKSGKHDSVFYRALWDTITAGEVWHGEITNRRKDGTLYVEAMTITPVRGNGDRVSHFIAIKQDVTERVRAEEARQQAYRELELRVQERAMELAAMNDQLCRKEAILAEAQRIAHLGSWDWDVATNELHWTDEIYRIFGLTPQEFGATYEAFLNSVHPSDRALVRASVDQALREKRPYSIAHRIVRPDGAERVVHERAEVYFDPKEQPVRMIGTVQDITEAHQTETALARARQRTVELEQLNKDLEAFSYSVSHELRAPLRGLEGLAALLEEAHASGLSAEGRRLVQAVRDRAREMDRLICALLNFARLGDQPLRKETVSLEALARQAWTELQPEREGRRVELAVANLPDCEADPALIHRVFVNLLSNALKFTRERKVAQIEVGWQPLETEKIVSVRDNGIGFEMRFASKLFGVFQRLHRMDQYEGCGIGLANVQRIIHRHGGRVWAEAELGKGAAFYFSLP
ncbi:MAG: PAS domain-containing protein [Verrucomicrobia bacterium]|nr:PAS domain-containing protein [Verrucomicrobiota bacterium]